MKKFYTMRIVTPNLPFYRAAHRKSGSGAAEFAFPGTDSLAFTPVRSAYPFCFIPILFLVYSLRWYSLNLRTICSWILITALFKINIKIPCILSGKFHFSIGSVSKSGWGILLDKKTLITAPNIRFYQIAYQKLHSVGEFILSFVLTEPILFCFSTLFANLAKDKNEF